MNSITEKDINRFWGKVSKDTSQTFYDNERCWEWTAHRNTDGYGQLNIGGKVERVHRVAWVIAYGEIPDGLLVCHRCDNRCCIRFSHLFLGTEKDNAIDREIKNRGNHEATRGDKNGTHTHPERVARGDKSSARLHPESAARGDRHGTHTHPERVARGDKQGLRLHPERAARGEKHGRAKLTWEQVREIRRRYKWLGIGGDSSYSLAREFGVTSSAILLIVKNKKWKE